MENLRPTPKPQPTLPPQVTQDNFVRSAYPFNYDPALASLGSGLLCQDSTRTQQQFQEECDINTIVKRFGVTGEMPQGVKSPLTGDFTTVTDYHTAANLILASDEAFMQMPADIRRRFNDDPGQFVDFVSDDQNRLEAAKLGILRPGAPDGAPPPQTPQAAASQEKAQSST